MRLSVPLALGTIPTLSHHLGSNSTEVTLSKGWSPSTIHLPCQDRGTATYGKVRLAVEEDDITITHVSFHHVARFQTLSHPGGARVLRDTPSQPGGSPKSSDGHRSLIGTIWIWWNGLSQFNEKQQKTMRKWSRTLSSDLHLGAFEVLQRLYIYYIYIIIDSCLIALEHSCVSNKTSNKTC